MNRGSGGEVWRAPPTLFLDSIANQTSHGKRLFESSTSVIHIEVTKLLKLKSTIVSSVPSAEKISWTS